MKLMAIRMAGRAIPLLALVYAGLTGAEPDEAALGRGQGYPVGTANTWYQMPYRVGSWSALDQVKGTSTRAVPSNGTPLPLPKANNPSDIRYRYRNLGYTLDEYLDRRRITGLLVIKDGQIVTERYRYDRTQEARFISFSMAKSVTSLLVGIAHNKGLIRSLDDPAEKYAKEMEGSPYGQTPIRALLRMSSGLTFTERYDGNDDIARMSRAAATGNPAVATVLRSIQDRHTAPGEKFVYASAETYVLGRVLAGATGQTLAALTADWLWTPLGAEHSAFWGTSHEGIELAHGSFNASLRDWGRLGILLAKDGQLNGTQIVPKNYLSEATDAQMQPPAFQPRKATPYFGYGYQFWLLPLKTRTFALQGIHGQAMYVQPATGIVMVHTAVYAGAAGSTEGDPYPERRALWLGVLRPLGGQTD